MLECTEASQTFSDKPVEGYDNMADVYTMALDKCSEEVVEQLPPIESEVQGGDIVEAAKTTEVVEGPRAPRR